MAKIKMVKLILPKAEIEKLTPQDKKRYVMFTSMLRDLLASKMPGVRWECEFSRPA
jgi:hypothetical protein